MPRRENPTLWLPTLLAFGVGLGVNAGPPLLGILLGLDSEAAWGLAWILAPLGGGAAATVLAVRLGSPAGRCIAIGSVGFLAAFFVASVLAYAFLWQFVSGGVAISELRAGEVEGIFAISTVSAGVGAILGLVFGRPEAAAPLSERVETRGR